MVKPSLRNLFLKMAYVFLSRLVSVGKSKNTSIHMTRYSLNLSAAIQSTG